MTRFMRACPCFDHADVNFVQCLVSLDTSGLECSIVFCASSLIYDARNNLAMRAIAEKYDYVLWLDSDMIFEPSLLKDLLATGKDLVSGLFFSRRPPYKPALFDECGYTEDEKKPNAKKPFTHNFYDYPKEQLFEVAAFGFAAVLTKVETLDIIRTVWGLPFTPLLGFGEDLSFCLRAKEIDLHLWTDSRIKVGHIGKMIVNEEVYQETRGLETKDE